MNPIIVKGLDYHINIAAVAKCNQSKSGTDGVDNDDGAAHITGLKKDLLPGHQGDR